MIKFTRSTKKKLDKVRHNTSSGTGRDRSRGPGDGGRSVSSAYSTHSTRSDYTDGGGKGTLGGMSSGGDNNNRRHSRNKRGAGGASIASSTGGSRRYSSAQSVASISSASVFAPSVVSGVS